MWNSCCNVRMPSNIPLGYLNAKGLDPHQFQSSSASKAFGGEALRSDRDDALGRIGLLRQGLPASSSSSSRREDRGRVVPDDETEDEEGEFCLLDRVGTVKPSAALRLGDGCAEGAGDSRTDEREPRIVLDMSVTSESNTDARFECFSKLARVRRVERYSGHRENHTHVEVFWICSHFLLSPLGIIGIHEPPS